MCVCSQLLIIFCEVSVSVDISRKPIRVLQVITGMGSGGAEKFLMNMYRNIDRNLVQFDFLLRSNDIIYEDEIKALGGRIFYTSEFPKHFIKNQREVRKILQENMFDAIHIHANAFLYVTPLIEAKRVGISCRFFHSHSTSSKLRLFEPIHLINRIYFRHLVTYRVACSGEAAVWMFGQPCTVINNAIDLDEFTFNEESREKIRKELNIAPEQFVLGHVGRFLPVKNHKFIIEVFKEILKDNPAAVLVLVGEGELFNEIKIKIENDNLSDSVRMLGARNDVNEILSALDYFIFPSLYEGLPLTLIEAQANGLPTLVSENITQQLMITDLISNKNISQGAAKWAEFINNDAKQRRFYTDKIQEAGFDIRTEAKRLQNIYLNEVEKAICKK